MPQTCLIRRLVLLAACLWLPVESKAGYDQAFLTLAPSASTPPFSWAHGAAPATSPTTEQENLPLDDRPSYNVTAWHSYIDRFIIPSLRAALSTRLLTPLPLPTSPQIPHKTTFEDDHGQPHDVRKDSPEPFIEVLIPLESVAPDPPITMHIQLLVPQETIANILKEALKTASAPEGEPPATLSSDRIQRTTAWQAHLDSLSDTLKDEATVQQHFRTASLTSSVLSVSATLAEIIALGTLPLHAIFTTIPMLMYYVVSEALGEDPLDRHWKLFSSASNRLLRTTFSDTLIPVP